MSEIRIADLFAGIGGIRMGMVQALGDAARVEDVGDVDFEDLACAAHAPVAHTVRQRRKLIGRLEVIITQADRK